MAEDPFLPFSTYPASDQEAYVVRGRAVGPFVEISLTRDSCEKHRFGSDTYTAVELLAVKRFRHAETSAYSAYAGNLETAATIAAPGELGYTVHTRADQDSVVISLVGRLLGPDGAIHTEISYEQRFSDPDSDIALVQANEKASELRAIAEKLNSQWVSLRDAHVAELKAHYESAEAQAAAAESLRQVVNDESD